MRTLWRVYDAALDAVMAAGMAASVVIIFVSIAMRFAFNAPLMWAEEVARYVFVWMVFVGAAVAARDGSHLVIDAFLQGMSPGLRRRLHAATSLLAVGTLLLIAYLSLDYVRFYWSATAYTVPWLKLGWVQLAVPVGSLLIAVNILRHLASQAGPGWGGGD